MLNASLVDEVPVLGRVLVHPTKQPVCLSPPHQVFIGLGFPYEGPAPLEAIAYGCVFLNPQLNPPVNRDNSRHFAKKPTGRAVRVVLTLLQHQSCCHGNGPLFAVSKSRRHPSCTSIPCFIIASCGLYVMYNVCTQGLRLTLSHGLL